MSYGRVAFWAALAFLLAGPASAAPPRQALDDAWWTGPLLAAAAGSLPWGHFLFEPYLYDLMPYASIDSHGVAHPVAHADDFGSQSYVLFGLGDGFSTGFIPRFGYHQSAGAKDTAGVALGDLTVEGQYQLTQFEEGNWWPTSSFNVSETLPIGRYERLDRLNDGLGAGAYTTTLSLYNQSFFWMPNGRLLCARLNLSYAFSNRVTLSDMSVYGTTAGFRGYASPGLSIYGDLGLEYSITKHWVAAMDLWLEQDSNTLVAGAYPTGMGGAPLLVRDKLGVSRSMYVAPALEYNFNGNVGVIAGARILAAGSNATATATPVVALNIVY